MTKKEVTRLLIECRSFLNAMTKFRYTPVRDIYGILDVFEVDKLIDDLENLLSNLDVIFVKEKKK